MYQLCSAQVPLSSTCCWPPPTPDAAALYHKAAAALHATEAPDLALQSHLLVCGAAAGLHSPAAAGGSLQASARSATVPAEGYQYKSSSCRTLDQTVSSKTKAAAPAAAAVPNSCSASAPALPLHRSDLFQAGEIVGGRFKVSARLAEGGFAVVYSATDLMTHQQVAVKVVCHCTTGPEGRLPAGMKWREVLSDEFLVYQHLGAVAPDTPPPGIPSVLGMGKELLLPVPGSTDGRCRLFSYLAMEQLGCDLWQLSNTQLYAGDKTRSFFVSHGLQMLQALQSMHKLGLVHADVKAENFAIAHTATHPTAAAAAAGSCHSLSSAAGTGISSSDQGRVYLLDMGFAHPWQGDLPGLPRRPKYYKGTPATSSISSMCRQGCVTPRDDCEALGYTLLDLWMGGTPWELTTDEEAAAGWSQQRLQEMASIKTTIIQQGIAEGTLPTWFYSWWSYITHPDVDSSQPDYQRLASIIRSTAKKHAARSSSTAVTPPPAGAAAAAIYADTAVAAAVLGRRKAALGVKAAAAAAARLFGTRVLPKQLPAACAAAAPSPAAAAAAATPAAGTKRKLPRAPSAGDAAAAAGAGAVFWQHLEKEVSLLGDVRAAKQPRHYHNPSEQQPQQGQELDSMYKVLLMDVGPGISEE